MAGRVAHRRFPRLYAAASLKRAHPPGRRTFRHPFSAALCRGLIEAGLRWPDQGENRLRFPRLYAAASLKRLFQGSRGAARRGFSAALCRGLIEARCTSVAASHAVGVFRGFMPRPH